VQRRAQASHSTKDPGLSPQVTKRGAAGKRRRQQRARQRRRRQRWRRQQWRQRGRRRRQQRRRHAARRRDLGAPARRGAWAAEPVRLGGGAGAAWRRRGAAGGRRRGRNAHPTAPVCSSGPPDTALLSALPGARARRPCPPRISRGACAAPAGSARAPPWRVGRESAGDGEKRLRRRGLRRLKLQLAFARCGVLGGGRRRSCAAAHAPGRKGVWRRGQAGVRSCRRARLAAACAGRGEARRRRAQCERCGHVRGAKGDRGAAAAAWQCSRVRALEPGAWPAFQGRPARLAPQTHASCLAPAGERPAGGHRRRAEAGPCGGLGRAPCALMHRGAGLGEERRAQGPPRKRKEHCCRMRHGRRQRLKQSASKSGLGNAMERAGLRPGGMPGRLHNASGRRKERTSERGGGRAACAAAAPARMLIQSATWVQWRRRRRAPAANGERHRDAGRELSAACAGCFLPGRCATASTPGPAACGSLPRARAAGGKDGKCRAAWQKRGKDARGSQYRDWVRQEATDGCLRRSARGGGERDRSGRTRRGEHAEVHAGRRVPEGAGALPAAAAARRGRLHWCEGCTSTGLGGARDGRQLGQAQLAACRTSLAGSARWGRGPSARRRGCALRGACVQARGCSLGSWNGAALAGKERMWAWYLERHGLARAQPAALRRTRGAGVGQHSRRPSRMRAQRGSKIQQVGARPGRGAFGDVAIGMGSVCVRALWYCTMGPLRWAMG
jgi:hypothetical protein